MIRGGTARAGRLAALLTLGAAGSGCQYIWPERYALREAQALEEKQQYAEAVKAYEGVFTKWPTKPEAIRALDRAAALYEERLSNWQKAATYLQELKTRMDGKPEYPGVLLRLGRVLEQAGSPYADALQAYGFLCKNCATAPEAVTAIMAQGRIHESLRNWPAAKSVYEDAVAKLGNSPQAGTARLRLQSIWLLEAVGMYYAGRVDDGALLAEEALKKGVSVEEVRNGLDALLKRYRNAQRLRRGNAGLVSTEDIAIVEAADAELFVYRAERDGRGASAPEGWKAEFDAKKKTLKIEQLPQATDEPVAPTRTGTGAAGAKKPARPKTPKLWKYTTPATETVEGWWWSPDGQAVGWIGKGRTGKRRTLNVVHLVKQKAYATVTDYSGTLLGHVMAFLPSCDKVVFPYEDFFAVSDLRGGNRNNFALRGDRLRKLAFKGQEVEWIASTPDGLELTVGVNQPGPKKPKKGEVVEKRTGVWKISLGVSQF